jgi:hypothetical protein
VQDQSPNHRYLKVVVLGYIPSIPAAVRVTVIQEEHVFRQPTDVAVTLNPVVIDDVWIKRLSASVTEGKLMPQLISVWDPPNQVRDFRSHSALDCKSAHLWNKAQVIRRRKCIVRLERQTLYPSDDRRSIKDTSKR